MDFALRPLAERCARISYPSTHRLSTLIANRPNSLIRRQRSRLQLTARRQHDENVKDNIISGPGNSSDSLINRSLDELKQLGEDLTLVRKAVESKDTSWAERSLKAILNVESLLKDTENALEEENVKSLASDSIQANKNSIYQSLEEIRDDIIMVSNMLNATKEQPKNEISVLSTQIKKIDRLLKEERRTRQKSGMFSATQIARDREKNVEIRKRSEAMNMLLSDADNIIDDAMGVLPSQDPRTLNGTIQHVLSSANDTMSRVYQLELELNRKSGELEETVRKYETVQADLQDLHSALQASQTEAEAANELAMTLEERVDMLQKSLDAAQSETVKYKKAFEDSSIEAKAASELADALKENTSLLEQSIEALKKELAELQEKYKTSQKDLVSTNELATGLKAKVESLENFLQEKEESLDDVQVTEALLAAKIASLEEELAARQAQIESLNGNKEEMEKLSAEAQAAKSRLIQVEKALQSAETEKSKVNSDLIGRSAQLADISNREMQLNKAKEELETELTSLQNVTEGLKQQLQTALEENRSNLDLIQKISKESEHYMSSSLERERMMNDQVESLAEQARIFEDEREELASLLQTTTETVESLSHENEVLKMEQEEVKSLLDSAKMDTKQFEMDLKALEDEKALLVQELEKSKGNVKKLKKSQDDSQLLLQDEMRSMEDMVESATNNTLELQAQVETLTNDQIKIQEELTESHNANEQLEEEVRKLKEELSKVVAEKDSTKQSMDEAEKKLQDMRNELEEKKSLANAELLDEIEKLQDSKNILQEEISDLLAKLEAAETKNISSSAAQLNGSMFNSISEGVDTIGDTLISDDLNGASPEEIFENADEVKTTVAVDDNSFEEKKEEQKDEEEEEEKKKEEEEEEKEKEEEEEKKKEEEKKEEESAQEEKEVVTAQEELDIESASADLEAEKETVNASCNGTELEVAKASSAGSVSVAATDCTAPNDNEKASREKAVSEDASGSDLEINTLEVLTQVSADQFVDSAVVLPIAAGTVKTVVPQNIKGPPEESITETSSAMFARANPIHKAANVIAKVLNSSRGEVAATSTCVDSVKHDKKPVQDKSPKKPDSDKKDEPSQSKANSSNKDSAKQKAAAPRERTWYP